ncbi:MAG: hypothetical protein CME19_10405 [Gemmatimonadetes bacterium]|nr:hypothetical protein [Gemmatimonadota bacterium]|tara:strand:+ start:347 stop:775 length:429 start_codon:yes stop_codon:yes gene_type:complete
MRTEQADLFSRQISELEKKIKLSIKNEPVFDLLKSILGIKDILGMTVYYEVGDIQRFKSDRNFSSYCRLAPPIAVSDGKNYQARGGKQGNPYLKWPFCVTATQAGRAYDRSRRFKQRHTRRRAGGIGKLKKRKKDQGGSLPY